MKEALEIVAACPLCGHTTWERNKEGMFICSSCKAEITAEEMCLTAREAAPKQREFFIDTPLGRLRVYAKHETDSPDDFPGVFVDFLTPAGDSVLLACTEYDTCGGKIMSWVYGDGVDDEPSHVERHRNLLRGAASRSENINNLRAIFPTGTRVELVKMDDMQAPPTGTEGTVEKVDDVGTIHVRWDNGSSLGLILDFDEFKKV